MDFFNLSRGKSFVERLVISLLVKWFISRTEGLEAVRGRNSGIMD